VAVDERWVRKALRASAVCWGSVEEGGVDVVAGGSEEGLEEATVGEEDIWKIEWRDARRFDGCS